MSISTTSGPILNIVPVSIQREKFIVGHVPYKNDEEYRKLREKHWDTHAFRYDSRSEDLLNVAIAPNGKPIGLAEEVDTREHLYLAARAIQRCLLVWLAGKIPIIKGGKQLVFWGQTVQALLLKSAVEKLRLEPVSGLEVAIKYQIDCRVFYDVNNQPYLGTVIDIGTANIIDISVADLLEKGFEPNGRYVCQRKEIDVEYLQSPLELLGRVTARKNDELLLTDTREVSRIKAQDCLLEPRAENLNDVIRLFYSDKAEQVIAELEKRRVPLTKATGKLGQIRKTVDRLQKQDFIIAGSVKVEFGDLITQGTKEFPEIVTTQRPNLLFGPQGRNRGDQPDRGITNWGPYMYMHNARNKPLIGVLCEPQHRGRIEQFLASLSDGLDDELWTNERRANPFKGGLVGKFRLANIQWLYEECSEPNAERYKAAAARLLQKATRVPDMAFVQIREDFRQLPVSENPYFVTKAELMTAGVPTQAFRSENLQLSQEGTAYLLNNLALAVYAKLDGIPWVMATYRPTTHEIVVGLGSAEISSGRLAQRTRYVGITTLFQGDGRYLLWGITREVEFENYAQALLESLRTTVQYVQQHNHWETGDSIRLIFHVYKRLRDCEVDAIKDLVQGLVKDRFQVEFAFLDISWSHPYNIFDPSEKGRRYWSRENNKHAFKGRGVPSRGLCFQIDKRRGLLHLTGPGDIKTEDQGCPKPLLVELHEDADFTDMTYLLRQIYHFSYMSWRSFFPGTEPVTITYSRLIAQLLGNLGALPGWSSTVLSVGNLRNRRWFL